MTLFHQNKLTEAIADAENIASIESETLGAVHDDVGATLRLLVSLHGASGNRDATRRARQNVLDFMKVKYGAHDWRFQHEQREFAANEQKADLPREKQPPPAQAREPAPTERIYYHLDHSEEAAVLLDAATSRYRPLVSKSPRDRADLLSDLALLLLGQTDVTLRPEKSAEVAKPERSASHSDHAAVLIDLARMAFERGDHRAARPLYEKAIQITSTAGAALDPDNHSVLVTLAWLLKEEGDYAAARLRLEQAVALAKARYWDDNPDYAETLTDLAVILIRLGDFAAAMPMLETAQATGGRAPRS